MSEANITADKTGESGLTTELNGMVPKIQYSETHKTLTNTQSCPDTSDINNTDSSSTSTVPDSNMVANGEVIHDPVTTDRCVQSPINKGKRQEPDNTGNVPNCGFDNGVSVKEEWVTPPLPPHMLEELPATPKGMLGIYIYIC